MLIYAASRPKNDPSGEPHRWTVETDDYDQGMLQVRGSVPEGWTLLYVRVDRDHRPGAPIHPDGTNSAPVEATA